MGDGSVLAVIPGDLPREPTLPLLEGRRSLLLLTETASYIATATKTTTSIIARCAYTLLHVQGSTAISEVPEPCNTKDTHQDAIAAASQAFERVHSTLNHRVKT